MPTARSFAGSKQAGGLGKEDICPINMRKAPNCSMRLLESAPVILLLQICEVLCRASEPDMGIGCSRWGLHQSHPSFAFPYCSTCPETSPTHPPTILPMPLFCLVLTCQWSAWWSLPATRQPLQRQQDGAARPSCWHHILPGWCKCALWQIWNIQH